MSQVSKVIKKSIEQLQIKLDKEGASKKYAAIFPGANEKLKQKFQKDFQLFFKGLSDRFQKSQPMSKVQSINVKIEEQEDDYHFEAESNRTENQYNQYFTSITAEIPDQDVDLEDRSLLKKIYPPTRFDYKSKIQQKFAKLIERNIGFITEKNDLFLGKYYFIPQQSTDFEKVFFISKGDIDFMHNLKSNQFMLFQGKKQEVLKWIMCFTKIVDSMTKLQIFNKDLQIRNTIKAWQIYLAIDFQDIFRLPKQKDHEVLQFISLWLRQKQLKEPAMNDTVAKFIEIFFDLQKILDQFSQNMETIKKSQSSNGGQLEKQFKLLKQSYDSIRSSFNQINQMTLITEEEIQTKAQEIYNLLRLLMNISHLIQYIVIIVNILAKSQQCTPHLLENTQFQLILNILQKSLATRSKALQLKRQQFSIYRWLYGQFEKSFPKQKIEWEVQIHQQYKQMIQIKDNKKKDIHLLQNYQCLIEYLSKINVMFTSMFTSQIKIDNALTFKCRNDSQPINSPNDIFYNSELRYLQCFIACAVDSLKELKGYGIYCPCIKIQDFVRQGYRFKIRHLKYALKVSRVFNKQKKIKDYYDRLRESKGKLKQLNSKPENKLSHQNQQTQIQQLNKQISQLDKSINEGYPLRQVETKLLRSSQKLIFSLMNLKEKHLSQQPDLAKLYSYLPKKSDKLSKQELYKKILTNLSNERIVNQVLKMAMDAVQQIRQVNELKINQVQINSLKSAIESALNTKATTDEEDQKKMNQIKDKIKEISLKLEEQTHLQ